MENQYVRLADIPAEGREFSFLDSEFWEKLLEEQELGYVFEPIDVSLTLFPQSDGVFLQGQLTGKLIAQCDRCLESATCLIEHPIEFFSSFDTDEQDSFLLTTESCQEIDMFLLLWEQLVLALPQKILCTEKCAGLCPGCGTNRNHFTCGCEDQAEKNPFALLRSLHLGLCLM